MSMSMGSEHFEWRLDGFYQCIMVQPASPGRVECKSSYLSQVSDWYNSIDSRSSRAYRGTCSLK